jgi:UDP-N-acetylglucosamine 2-epimerase
VNRRCISALATWHFAPTEGAREVLLREGAAPDRVLVTGNTVIDALHDFRDRLEAGLPSGLEQLCPGLDSQRRLIVVTGHRRESFDGGIERVCHALLALARRPEVQIVFPVHPNPRVRGPVGQLLGDHPDITLLEPLDYLPFVDLLRRSYLVLTDSGGIQEEAAALGKPALVMRDTTERPEGVAAGTARLVGTETARIVTEAERLLDDAAHHRAMSRAHDAYGDGHASARIVEALLARE